MPKELYCNIYVHILAVENNSTRKCEVVPVRGMRHFEDKFYSFTYS